MRTYAARLWDPTQNLPVSVDIFVSNFDNVFAREAIPPLIHVEVKMFWWASFGPARLLREEERTPAVLCGHLDEQRITTGKCQRELPEVTETRVVTAPSVLRCEDVHGQSADCSKKRSASNLGTVHFDSLTGRVG